MFTPADLEVISDPSLPRQARRAAMGRAREGLAPPLFDTVLDTLVHALNEQPGSLHAEIIRTLRHLDAWLMVGVRHGLIVRARVGPVDVQLDADLTSYDADIGRVVDLAVVHRLVPELADPPEWLVRRHRARLRTLDF